MPPAVYGARGDVEPVAAPAARLRALGAEVRVRAPPDEVFAEPLDRTGVPVAPFERPRRSPEAAPAASGPGRPWDHAPMGATGEHARLWVADGSPQVELLSARFQRFAFDRHSHEQLSVGVIEQGAEGLHMAGGKVVVPAGQLVIINPGQVHTGFAAEEAGWRYRMFYFDTAMVGELAREHLGARDVWFTETAVQDPGLFARLRSVHREQEGAADPLTAESLLLGALEAVLRRHARTGRAAAAGPGGARGGPDLARRVLHDRWTEPVTVAELSAAADMPRASLIAAFRRAYGLPPHAYLLRLRANRARRLLLEGRRPAEVAAAAGFADQAHLTRVCKRYFGVTPGAIRA
ncbi:AraC family transcriptional regulator [Nocardiopsis sp. CNT-189]|uniref:AraC family ligand binding domain-containing protein n=1 Tax=Nocardiopsis oceanisediminis TaxID=2816862 RepID=UPI003B311BC0